MTELLSDRSDLLNTLWHFQNQHGYIRDDDVKACSDALNLSQIEVEGVISFYHFFHRQPCGQFTVYLNNSIVSQFKGYDRIKEAFERETGGRFNGVDPSGQFGLYETPCIGLGDQEPAALIDFCPFTNLHSLKIRDVVAKLKRGASPASLCDEVPDHIRSVPEESKTILLRDYDPGAAITRLKDFPPESVIEEIKRSGLCGLGGAYFPTGRKWEACRHQSEPTRYVVCNADEGEPGTFKDRVLMNALPGLMLEGMIVAGYAIGAKEGIIYLRAEFTWLKNKLLATIEHFKKMNLLGENVGGIPGFDFQIRIQLGAGSYVCGEETALLNSLEGKRGEPRTRQYYPTERGYLGQPTIVNNVETLCVAARILELGADEYLKTGTPTSPGTKLLSVSGDCRLPGIYEIEWGTPVKDILEKCQADQPHFIQLSGPAGFCISMKDVDRTIAIDDLRCGGSFMVFNESRDVIRILQNYAEFFKHESCGLCTPCRAGNYIVQRKLNKIALKLARQSDFESIRSWGKIMAMTSRCGLGKTATRSLVTAIDKFPESFESLVEQNSERQSKGFDLAAAVREYDRFNS